MFMLCLNITLNPGQNVVKKLKCEHKMRNLLKHRNRKSPITYQKPQIKRRNLSREADLVKVKYNIDKNKNVLKD